MSSNYYDMQKGKVRIAHELMNRGWKVYGYRADESDSMTDYYSPAHWWGIATKNGFVLVVDRSENGDSGKDITKYNPKGNLSIEDREKITKLEAMTVSRGCTAGEEENAKKLIEKLKSKISGESAYEVVDRYPEFMPNPGKCKWHIEKDGKIYDKGTGITKYADMPDEYIFDINTMKYKDSYRYVSAWDDECGDWKRVERNISEDEKKVINDFKSLILKFERVVNNMNSCGDGTKENELKAAEQQEKIGYEKVIITESKTVTKPVEVTDRKNIMINDILTFKTGHGWFWQVINIWQNDKGINCYTYEILGSEKRGYQRTKNARRYYQTEIQISKAIENSNIKIHTMQTVTETTEVEKWVKIDKSKNTYNSKPENKQKEKKEEVKTETIDNSITSEDQATPKQLWALHCATKLNTKELKISKSKASDLIGKSKAGEDITEIIKALLNNETVITDEPKQSKAQETADIITDYSTDIIIELGLKPIEYSTNEQYKIMLTEKLHKHNIDIAAAVIDCIEFDGLKQVLNTIKSEVEQKQQQEKQQVEKASLFEKIEKNIESLQNKITALSGDYKVNTYKRMQEQAGRDSKINSYEIDIKLLEYVLTKVIENEPITALEKGLIVGAFRDTMHQYYITKYGKYPKEIKFPEIDYQLPLDGWWNKEVPQRQNKLRKYGITDTSKLNQAIDEYKIIYNSIDRYVSQKEQQIKKLTNQYKMSQKGDIHFTTNKNLLQQLIELADITEQDHVLEPSAGIGSIADELKKYTNNVDCCEYMTSYSELLKLKGFNITASDFLSYDKLNYYDKVVANVPFSDEQNHVKHIYKVLKPGGRAVVITSNHWTFANDRTSQEFRNWLNNLTYEVYDVPQKSFEFTNVSAKILVIEKDINSMQEAV